jgi:hypothetical protein
MRSAIRSSICWAENVGPAPHTHARNERPTGTVAKRPRGAPDAAGSSSKTGLEAGRTNDPASFHTWRMLYDGQ